MLSVFCALHSHLSTFEHISKEATRTQQHPSTSKTYQRRLDSSVSSITRTRTGTQNAPFWKPSLDAQPSSSRTHHSFLPSLLQEPQEVVNN